ncbi:CBS domain-containing protein [Hyphomicrobium sp.]|uniref:CBS domain-containing protein n=1 Tax=Hyphomicrobium sp. TaxID=82 RepID=UPI002D77C6D1|nr:CBS domain-containing protein [Hyphomicrobium sp.]HET6390191.1 CBS domain-containing protein [Hyphomicrobium sp.]
MKVANILQAKGTEVVTVRPGDSVCEVAHRLVTENVGAVVVSSGAGTLDGMISERDISSGVAFHGSGIGALHASDVMSRNVPTCAPDDPIAETARFMTDRRIRHLPVRDGARVVGIISIGDVLKYRLEEARLETRVLRDIALVIR